MPTGGCKFIFKYSTRYRIEHEKIKFISTSWHVIFCLFNKHTYNDIFDNFPKITDQFLKILKTVQQARPTFPNII